MRALPRKKMAAKEDERCIASRFTPRQLSLPGRTLPPALPLIISCQDNWNSDTCKLETAKEAQDHRLKLVQDALELLRSIDKPLAVLSICGPYPSGKSYLMSRLLGSPDTFKLGHTMRACTRGIWMATTVLECDDFAAILLDTEGIDAVGASETMAMSLLTLTTLLSSYFIYNSKRVPQKGDLDKMRCFSQLSTSLVAQRGESMTSEAMKKFFPHFLWLLRDVSLKMTNKEGEMITPTEYLHTRLLAAKSGELTELGESLFSLFPCLQCSTLPIASSKPDVIRNIVEQQDKLNPAFNIAVNELIQRILQQVSPKKAIDGVRLVTGSKFAALTCGYVEAVNTPGALPDLEQGWQAMVRLELKEYSNKLVRDYEREMEETLKGKLPMEEKHFLAIHEQILNMKKNSLRHEIQHINPLHSGDGDVQPLLNQLEQEIIIWSEPEDGSKRKVVGGNVYKFTIQNLSESKEQCETVFRDLMKSSKVQEKFNEALQTSKPLDISAEIQAISLAYVKKSIGPAAKEVLEKALSYLTQLSNSLKKIPGKPQNLKVVGTAKDRIKLSWEPPEHNPEAAEIYVVSKRVEGCEWEEAKKTSKTKALMTELKSNHKYEFKVMATNSLITSIASGGKSRTKLSAAGVAGMGTVLSLLGLPLLMEYAIRRETLECATTAGMLARLGLCVVSLPVGIALAPITAPILIGLATGTQKPSGDLTDE